MKKYLLFTALWWTIVFDWPFWQGAIAFYRNEPNTLFLVLLGTAFALLAVAFVRLLAFLPFRVFQALMVLLSIAGAAAYCGALLYGVPITPDMMRNVIATDMREASGYLSLKTVVIFLLAVLPPLAATFFVAKPIARERWRFVKGLGLIVGCLVLGLGVVALNFQDAAGLFRGANKSQRYYIAPFNVLYSSVRTVVQDAAPDEYKVRKVVDARPEMSIKPERPMLMVVMVGETTRRANWELAGYSKETNPELKRIPDLINFMHTTSCGTSTDVSVPCMFSRVGRHNYDREQILQEEPLPSLLSRAGFKVAWIDNQSGCKGACYNVAERKVNKVDLYCPGGDCFDDAFFPEIDEAITHLSAVEPTVLFLHMMSSHGPAYYKRSMPQDKKFGPECRDADLSSCSRESIVAAYDNSVRNTDRVIAGVIERLAAAKGYDTALIYASDHGESLGEDGLYLHGAPWWMAPDVQKEIPMVMWFSPEFKADFHVNEALLRERAANAPSSHDNLYHTIMGLLGVKGSTYERDYDLNAPAP